MAPPPTLEARRRDARCYKGTQEYGRGSSIEGLAAVRGGRGPR